MKKIVILFFIGLILLQACTKKDPSFLKLFNDVGFQLIDGENNALVDTILADEYRSYVLNPDYEFPLYRHIEHENYQIFIALPFNMDTEKLFNLEYFNLNEIAIINNNNSIFFKHQNKDRLVTEYLFQHNQSVFHFLCITDDEQIHNNLLSQENLSKRIILK